MSARRVQVVALLLIAALVFFVFAFGGRLVVGAQTSPLSASAPTTVPTSTSVSICPPDLQDECEWVSGVVSNYGIPVLLVIGLALGGVWIYRRFSSVAGEKVEETLKKKFEERESVGELSDATRRYLEKPSKTIAISSSAGWRRARVGSIRLNSIRPTSHYA